LGCARVPRVHSYTGGTAVLQFVQGTTLEKFIRGPGYDEKPKRLRSIEDVAFAAHLRSVCHVVVQKVCTLLLLGRGSEFSHRDLNDGNVMIDIKHTVDPVLVKQRLAKEEAAARQFAIEASVIHADVQRDLDEAMPAFCASVDALKSLNKNDINELKALRQPPELVALTLEAVCILFGVKPDWGEAKKLMSDGFLEKLQNYDKDNQDEKKIKNIQKYMKNENFLPEMVGKVSKAAKSLCMWVRAMDTYERVAKTVEPKKAKLLAVQKQLADSQTELLAVQKQLADSQTTSLATPSSDPEDISVWMIDFGKSMACIDGQQVRAEPIAESPRWRRPRMNA